MKRIDLIKVDHPIKIRDKCPYIKPNVNEDCIFYLDGKPIGFYISRMPDKMSQLANIANAEFMSKRVEKQGRGGTHTNKKVNGVVVKAKKSQSDQTKSTTIIGMIPPQPRFGRNYCKASNLHSNKSAQTFIKSMILLAKEGESLIKQILPEQYDLQKELLKDCKFKLTDLFTSSISNLNVAAPYHQDKANIENTVNIIICKRSGTNGGDLTIPDFGATIGQTDNSILVYPAWKSIHGVTPIIKANENSYRNSLVFYPLKYNF